MTSTTTITVDERKALRRKALWRVSDFAAYVGISRERARRALLRYNVELGDMLLRPTSRTNRGYTFFWAALAKHAPAAFLEDPLEQQRRVDVLEDLVSELSQSHRIIAVQTGANTRAIERVKRTGKAA